jgi:hypothetical protein
MSKLLDLICSLRRSKPRVSVEGVAFTITLGFCKALGACSGCTKFGLVGSIIHLAFASLNLKVQHKTRLSIRNGLKLRPKRLQLSFDERNMRKAAILVLPWPPSRHGLVKAQSIGQDIVFFNRSIEIIHQQLDFFQGSLAADTPSIQDQFLL